MAFTGHNQALYNAAFNGFMAGYLAQSSMQDATAADYNNLAAAATAFATQVDAGVAADATLTTAGASVVPATAANQANAIAKPQLMFSLCFGYAFGRGMQPVPNATAASYAVPAAAIAAAFTTATGANGYGAAPGGTSLS